MAQYKSFRTQKEILNTLYEDEKKIKDRIEKQTSINTRLKEKSKKLNKIFYTFQIPQDFSSDFTIMEVENTVGTPDYTRQFLTWTFHFPSIDVRLLPYFKADVIFKEPGTANVLPVAFLHNINKSFLIKSSSDPDLKSVNLIISAYIQISDNTVPIFAKVNLFFNNPYLFK